MKQYLTIKELAVMLQLKTSTIYSLVYAKKIPYKKIGTGKRAALRFDPTEIEAWINPIKITYQSNKVSNRKRVSSIDSIIQDAIADVVKS